MAAPEVRVVNTAGVPAPSAESPRTQNCGAEGRRRCGSVGTTRARNTSFQPARERAATCAASASDEAPATSELDQIAQVLTEENAAPGAISLAQAPILGDRLLNVVKEDGEAKTSGAGSVQDLQRKIEQVTMELQTRFEQQQERFEKRVCDISFDEPDIEEDFRNMTFDLQRNYMYVMAIVVMLYSVVAALVYNVSAHATLPATRVLAHATSPRWPAVGASGQPVPGALAA